MSTQLARNRDSEGSRPVYLGPGLDDDTNSGNTDPTGIACDAVLQAVGCSGARLIGCSKGLSPSDTEYPSIT
eukprot:983257-Rhodomonas_salina.1